MSAYEQASPKTQPSPSQRGKREVKSPQPNDLDQYLNSNSRQPSILDNVSTTATTGGDSPTPESLRQPIDPARFSDEDTESELDSSTTENKSKPSMTDKLQGKIQMAAGKISKDTELYEKGELRQSGK
ncbi:hypothetical protein Clacol_009813 [Clathrus columnatus]|uniref:Uncharacterized protein n=1 Tax=Clathrus columnatus TaxID=1419009 RepID=A0AAV5AUH2_9AGAM|nr:hypothetical protein Clacol_009813 [Clathrus columnatus]